jgi:hypothetical protein
MLPLAKRVIKTIGKKKIMSIKRVILVNHSRLLLEMFQRALDKAEGLEVVQEIINNEELPFAIQRFCPDWVILSLPISDSLLNWISIFMQSDPSVRFILLSEDRPNITMRWQMTSEQDLSDISLKEFIYVLEKDLQNI